jgi:tripartite-type tricarboxylate transporter receptor subunit TctC
MKQYKQLYTRRQALAGMAAVAASLCAPLAMAQGGDSGAMIRMIVPFAAGGGTDNVARLVADGLRDKLKTVVVIENRGGAGGTLGAAEVARAKPDGRTLLFTPQSPVTIAQFVEPKPPFDPEKAFVPLAILAKTPLVLLINANVPVKNFRELVAYSKAHPKELNYGAPSHEFTFTTELLARESGLQMAAIPYRGSSFAMTDLLGGSIQALLSSGAAAKAQLQQGKVRAIAVVGKERSADFPDVPSTGEAGINNLKVFGWFGLFAPAGTPEATVNRISQAALALANDPAYRAKLKQAGYEAMALGREQSEVVLAEHRAAWRSVAPHIKP